MTRAYPLNPRYQPTSRYITLNGLKFHYLDWGHSGRPVLLCLHGSTGQAHSWDFLGEVVGDEWRLLALDMRGHGKSEWASGDYPIASFAGDIAKFVAHIGVTSIHLVGLSLGGIVAMTYSGMFPERVSRLVLVDIAPQMSAVALARLTRSGAYPEAFESLDAAVAWAKTDYLWAGDAALKDDLAIRLLQRDDGRWGWKFDLDLFSPANRTRWAGEACERWTLFGRIDCPILEVRGELSELVSDEIVERMKTINPQTRHVNVPSAGHNVIADQPVSFAEIALAFLRGD